MGVRGIGRSRCGVGEGWGCRRVRRSGRCCCAGAVGCGVVVRGVREAGERSVGRIWGEGGGGVIEAMGSRARLSGVLEASQVDSR